MRSQGLVSCKAYIHCPYKLTGLIMPWGMSRNWQLTVYDDVSVRQLHVELFSECVSTPQSTYALQVWDNNFHIFEVKGLVFTALDGCKSLAARSGSFIPSRNWKWGWWVAQQVWSLWSREKYVGCPNPSLAIIPTGVCGIMQADKPSPSCVGMYYHHLLPWCTRQHVKKYHLYTKRNVFTTLHCNYCYTFTSDTQVHKNF